MNFCLIRRWVLIWLCAFTPREKSAIAKLSALNVDVLLFSQIRIIYFCIPSRQQSMKWYKSTLFNQAMYRSQHETHKSIHTIQNSYDIQVMPNPKTELGYARGLCLRCFFFGTKCRRPDHPSLPDRQDRVCKEFRMFRPQNILS